jgi:hypothetical protein
MRAHKEMVATNAVPLGQGARATGDDHSRIDIQPDNVIPTNTAVNKVVSSDLDSVDGNGDGQQGPDIHIHGAIPTHTAAIENVFSDQDGSAAREDFTVLPTNSLAKRRLSSDKALRASDGDDQHHPDAHWSNVIPTNSPSKADMSSDQCIRDGNGDGHISSDAQIGDAIPTNTAALAWVPSGQIIGAAREDATVLPPNSLAKNVLSSDHMVVASDGGSNASAPTRRKAVRRAKAEMNPRSVLPDAINSADHLITDTHDLTVSSGGGQWHRDRQRALASPTQSVGQLKDDTQPPRADEGIDHSHTVTHFGHVDPQTIAAIMSLHREHRSLQRAVGDMERRIKSEERWFAVRRCREQGIELKDSKFPPVTAEDKMMVVMTRPRFFAARDAIEVHRKACQKELIKATKSLPIAPWVDEVKGLGIASVAAVIGEVGDFHSYRNVAQVWKRMGLAVIGGKAQGKRTNAEEALLHGYNPRRRSEMHVIGDCLVRARGPYADLYKERKEYELAREGITKMHAHKRALRYIEKRLLREMWAVWRGTNKDSESKGSMSPATIIREAA